MGKPTGFIEIQRKKHPTRPVEERVQDWREVYLPYPKTDLQKQGARCMDCGIPFCHQGCPLGNLIPDWNDLVYRDRWRAAIDRLHATNNFPEFTGRLCPAPCEGSCVLGINDDPVTIKAVEVSIIDRAFDEGWIAAAAAAYAHVEEGGGRRIGAGRPGRGRPAQSRRPLGDGVREVGSHRRAAPLRHPRVQDGEARPRRGVWRSWRRKASSSGRASTSACDVPVSRLTLRLRRSAPGGGRRALRAISPCRAASWRGSISRWSTSRSRTGAAKATRFPTTQFISAEGKHVIIIGGGDTGADCLGTAHRQGARSVTQLELLPIPPPTRAADNPWPQWPHIFRVSHGARRRRRAALLGEHPAVRRR